MNSDRWPLTPAFGDLLLPPGGGSPTLPNHSGPSLFPWRPALKAHSPGFPPWLLSPGSLLLSAWEISLINSFMLIGGSEQQVELPILIHLLKWLEMSVCPVALSPCHPVALSPATPFPIHWHCHCLSDLLFTVFTPAFLHVLPEWCCHWDVSLQHCANSFLTAHPGCFLNWTGKMSVRWAWRSILKF